MLTPYDIARLDGFQGSETEFLKSKYLEGGIDLAKSIGFAGTESEIQDLFISKAQGLTPYDMAVLYGFRGTAKAWLESLHGADGLDAYTLAVTKGYQGTEDEWIDSLKGQDGLDAYQLALTKGFEGSLEDFLSSLNGKNATPEMVRDAVSAYLTANPPADGKNATPEMVRDAVNEYLRLNPVQDGEMGPMPNHQIDGRRIRFQKPDGSYGEWIDFGSVSQSSSGGGGSLSIQKFYDSSDDFPTPGKTQILYFDRSNDPYGVFVWTGTEYQQVGGGGSSGSVFGLFKGSFDTFSEMEAVEAENGDWAILKVDDGENESGIYVKADTGFEFSADLVTLNEQDIRHSFETVSKNLSASDATLTYTGQNLNTVVYSNGITKTLGYEGLNLVTITLSGSTPGGIDLVKTLTYTGNNLTGVTYS